MQLSPRRVTALALVALAGSALSTTARADDDDAKLLNLKPAVLGKLTRSDIPDAWKLNHAPIPGAGADGVFESRNMVLKAHIPLNLFPGFSGATSPTGADCWGYTSPSGREYALMGLSWGNGIVEVTDPLNPVVITTIPGGINSLWRDITVVGHYAYAATDNDGVGIQVMDLSNIDAGVVTHVRNYSNGGHTKSHTLLSNPQSGYLYSCGGNATGAGGFQPISTLADPTFPTFTGPGWTTQYVHEAQIATYPAGTPYAGQEIAFLFAAGPYYGSSYTRAMAIVDITNKAAPQELSFISYPGMRFCHQGWTSPDFKYLYINDELDAPTTNGGNVPRFLCRVFDITDLANPRLVSVFTNGIGAVDHNEYTKGRYLYQSNYSSGLRVWDTFNPLRPVEIAWLDTRPEDDGTAYDGAWGNYPLFDSGTILISDLQRGLFVTRLSLLELTPQPALPETIVSNQPTPVSITVKELEATTAAVNLMVSINGDPFTSHAMTGGAGGVYTGAIPATPAFSRIRYYFAAETSEATPRTFTWPLTTDTYLNAYSQGGQTTLFADTFETTQGWTVVNTAGLTAGAWTRATPMYNGGPGAVIGDADGSGMCYVTGNTLNEDVDGGTTRLLSPTIDLSQAPEARITYSRWLLSLVGTVDPLITEISANNGSTWTQVSSISPATGGWQQHTFRVADFITPTAQVRLRFSVADTGSSTTEAGIDAVTIVSPTAPVACYANCDGSTISPILNVADFSCFLNAFAAGDSYANCDGSTLSPILNVADFACFLNAFAAGCP
jgi:choice-of-anchor B domain-containing protein